MILNEDIGDSRYQIKAYDPGVITINEETFQHSLIVSPTQLNRDWPIDTIDDLSSKLIEPILKLQPEVVLLGTGDTLEFPSAATLAPFYENNVGIECMTNAAACRTFVALAAEDRNVVAAIIINQGHTHD